MAARFPASASMQKMASNPQQASMFQRSQFQQSPYGMAVSSHKFELKLVLQSAFCYCKIIRDLACHRKIADCKAYPQTQIRS